jgi:hypothetical protein
VPAETAIVFSKLGHERGYKRSYPNKPMSLHTYSLALFKACGNGSFTCILFLA